MPLLNICLSLSLCLHSSNHSLPSTIYLHLDYLTKPPVLHSIVLSVVHLKHCLLLVLASVPPFLVLGLSLYFVSAFHGFGPPGPISHVVILDGFVGGSLASSTPTFNYYLKV